MERYTHYRYAKERYSTVCNCGCSSWGEGRELEGVLGGEENRGVGDGTVIWKTEVRSK